MKKALALVLVLTCTSLLLSSCAAPAGENLPGAQTPEVEEAVITSLSFYDASDREMTVGGLTYSSWVNVDPKEFDPDDIEFGSMYPDVASITKGADTYGALWFEVTALKPGKTGIYVQNKDGSIKEMGCAITVTEDNTQAGAEFDFDVQAFAEAFNAKSIEFGDAMQITGVSDEGDAGQYQLTLNTEVVAMVVSANQTSGAVKDITVVGAGDGTEDTGKIIASAYLITMGALDSSLTSTTAYAYIMGMADNVEESPQISVNGITYSMISAEGVGNFLVISKE